MLLERRVRVDRLSRRAGLCDKGAQLVQQPVFAADMLQQRAYLSIGPEQLVYSWGHGSQGEEEIASQASAAFQLYSEALLGARSAVLHQLSRRFALC